MLRLARMPCCWIGLLVVLAGCAENPMVLKGRLSQAEQEQTALRRQNQQLQDRLAQLDRDHQEQTALLAQSRQQTKVSEDQLEALRTQLRLATTQLAQIRTDKEGADRRVQALATSMQRNGGVTIGANNSLAQTLPATNIPGIFVRNDGNVIRVELPAPAVRDWQRPAPARSSQQDLRRGRRDRPHLSRSDHRRRGPHRQRPVGRQPVAGQPGAFRCPRGDGLRRARQSQHAAGTPTVVHRRQGLDQPDHVERHARRETAQPAG